MSLLSHALEAIGAATLFGIVLIGVGAWLVSRK